MTKDLTSADLENFQSAYEQTPCADVIARAVQENGVTAASKNFAAKAGHDHVFSVEVETGKITNQKKSGRCWLFSTLNTLRQQVARDLKVKDFEFSQNYDSFYDRLEKANMFYEKMIRLAERDDDDREYLFELDWGDEDGGQFANAAALINKYGLVPKSVMPETFVSENTSELNDVLNLKIKKDALEIRKMKKEGTHLCCSIGFLTEKQALMLKEAGLDRINHNLNSSRAYYSHICSTHTFEQRVQNIKMLQRLGFEICSGGIIGMGESKEDVVDMLLELREIKPEALPINFLLPIPGTPLGDADISGLTTEYCMKVLCLARLLVPQSDIRCAAGREVYFKGEEKRLLSVVDSIFASGYLTADGQGIKDTIQTITDAGFTYEIESA